MPPPCCQPAGTAPPLPSPSLELNILSNGTPPLCSTSFRINGFLETSPVEIVSLQGLRNSKVFNVACAPAREWKPIAALLLQAPQTPAPHQLKRASSPSIVDRFCPYRQRAHKATPNRRRAGCRTPGHDSYMTPAAASNRPATPSRPWAPSPSVSPTSDTSPWGPAITNAAVSSPLADGECDSGQSSLLTSRLPDGQTRYGLISVLRRLEVSLILELDRSYHLDIVQHPIRTAAFGQAGLSRLPLAPPVVVQLVIRDRAGRSINP